MPTSTKKASPGQKSLRHRPTPRPTRQHHLRRYSRNLFTVHDGRRVHAGFELAGARGKRQARDGGDAGVVLAAQQVGERRFSGGAAGADDQGVASAG